jgi:hypothetical protein
METILIELRRWDWILKLKISRLIFLLDTWHFHNTRSCHSLLKEPPTSKRHENISLSKSYKQRRAKQPWNIDNHSAPLPFCYHLRSMYNRTCSISWNNSEHVHPPCYVGLQNTGSFFRIQSTTLDGDSQRRMAFAIIVCEHEIWITISYQLQLFNDSYLKGTQSWIKLSGHLGCINRSANSRACCCILSRPSVHS